MADYPQKEHPATLDELTEELDADVPSDAPNPRVNQPSDSSTSPEKADKDTISDSDLQEAIAAADETDEEALNQASLPAQSLHVESNPYAPRPPFWKRKKFWFTTIFLFILTIALAWFIQPSRFFLVNMFGLRGSLDISTMTLPDPGQESGVLKKVTIELNGEQWETNDEGKINAKLPYAAYTIVAKKAGYQDVLQTATVDFDPFFYLLGGRQQDEKERTITLQLKAVGIPLTFKAQDWLTQGPLNAGAFSVGEVVAKPNDQGVVSFTIPATEQKTIKVTALFGGKYIDKEFEILLDGTQPTIGFVPEGKDYFISNRTGLAIYSAYLDGTNPVEVVPPSAKETSAVAIAISPSGKYGLLASTRDDKKDAQGTLLQQLYIIDLSNKKLAAVDQGNWFSFVDWAGDTLVYTVGERKAGAAGISQRLSSIDAANAKRTDISTANSFGMVRVAIGSVVYQVNLTSSETANSPELRVTAFKGGTEKKIGNKVQQLSQPDADRFSFQSSDGSWQEYNVNTSQVKISAAPSSTTRAILATPTLDGQNRLVIDTIDGKPALIIKNVGNGQEKQIYTAAGIRGPVRLVDDTIVFRMIEGNQVADYAVSIRGGAPRKITDVTVSAAPFATPSQYYSFF